jgi:hypothetical protein
VQGLLLDRNLGGSPLSTDLEMHRMVLDEQNRGAKSGGKDPKQVFMQGGKFSNNLFGAQGIKIQSELSHVQYHYRLL